MRILLPIRRSLEARIGERLNWDVAGCLAGLAVIDGLAVLAVWLVGYAALVALFSGADTQSRFATAVLRSLLDWRLYMLAFRLVLRPDLPGARLAAMGDADALAVYQRISIVILAIIVIRIVLKVLIAIESPHDAIAAAQIAATLVILVLFLWATRASRTAVAGWFRPSLGHTAARYWHVLAILVFLVFAASYIYGAIAARYTVVVATILTFNMIIALLLLQTLLVYVVRQPELAATPEGGEAAATLDGQAATRLRDLIARCLRVAVLIGAAVIIGQTWIVNVLALVDAAGWAKLTRSSITAGLTLYVAFIAWEVVKFVTARYVAKQGGGGIPGEDENAQEGGGSRLATLMPLVRVALAIASVSWRLLSCSRSSASTSRR